MYKINNKTLYFLYNGYNTIIKEINNTYEINGDILKKILDYSCIYYGSSFKGRIKGSQNLLEAKYKIPIIVSEKERIIFFPLKTKNEYMWINFNLVTKYFKENNKVKVIFKDDTCEIFDVSYTIFHNQILKCSRLCFIFLSRC